MGTLRTLIAVFALSATQAVALPKDASDQARMFAGCAGRYSAEAEHAQLFSGVPSDEAETRRDLFLTLLDAVLPDAGIATKHLPLSWRIDAKAAHSALLATSVFGIYPERSARAGALADLYIQRCDRLILPV